MPLQAARNPLTRGIPRNEGSGRKTPESCTVFFGWHLHEHSWEIEELGLWDELRQMLDYVSSGQGVTYVPNRGVLKFLPAHKAPLSVNHLTSSK